MVSALNGQVVIGDTRNIMWLSNANLADTMSFGVSGVNPNGSMNWDTSLLWINAMNSYGGGTGYLGFDNSRLGQLRYQRVEAPGGVRYAGSHFPIAR